MVKFTSTLVVFLICTLPLFAQDIRISLFRNYPVVANVDSLEKVVAAQKNNPDQYLLGMVTLERSRGQLSSDKFGEYLPLIDSLSRNRNLPNIQAAYLILQADRINYDGHERVKTLEYVNKALAIFTQQKDTTGMIRCYSKLRYLNVTGAQRIDGSAEMAGVYFQNLATLADKSGWPGDKLIATFNRYSQHPSFFQQHPDSLIHLIKQALTIVKANPEFSYFKPGLLNILSIAYAYKDDYQQALQLVLECLRLSPEQWYSSKILYNQSIGNIYFHLKDYANAESYYKESARLGELHKSAASSQIDAVYSVALAQYDQNKYKEASDNFIKVDSLKDAMQTELRTRDFLELQTKYETKKKEQANRTLQKEKQSYELGIFISVVLLGIISLLLFYLYRKNTQLNEYAHFRDHIFAIISHDLRSPVLALEGLSKQGSYLMKRGQMDSLEVVAQKIDASIVQLNRLLNNLLAWAISQNTRMNTKMEILSLLPIVDEIVSLYAEIASAKAIVIAVDVPADLFICANRNGLSVIIRNLVDNAVKNAASQKINLTATHDRNNVILRVINNDVIVSKEVILKIQQQLEGIKANYLQTASGFGLQLIAYFTKLHNGSVTMNSTAEEGTVFTVVLPA